MCRFTLYLGPPVRLSTLLTEPEHSLILQSFHARERVEPLNGDGFGIGWYAPRLNDEPGLFHQMTPAWSSRNLRAIARVVTSTCVMAHVRAATPGSEVDLANCHPFAHGRYLLMHNGNVGGFRKMRRKLLESLTDEAFGIVRGSTDTEHLFAVFIDEIVRRGQLPLSARDPGRTSGAFNAATLTATPAPPPADGAIALAEHLAAAIARVLEFSREYGGGEQSFLNVAVSDGDHVAVCRFDSGGDRESESLYFLHGEMYEPTSREFVTRRPEDEGESMVVSSERLTADARWAQVPPSHMLVLDRELAPRILRLDADARIDGGARVVGRAADQPSGAGSRD